jgi:hypothetical protein
MFLRRKKKILKRYLFCNVFYSLQEFYLNNNWHGLLVGKSVCLFLCTFVVLTLIKIVDKDFLLINFYTCLKYLFFVFLFFGGGSICYS